MKVYITTCKDGYGGYEVDKVFAQKAAAVDYLIIKHYGGEFYSGTARWKLEENCEPLISEYEVE